MSGNGAFPEEMDFSHPEIATFARALQATLVREPDPAASEPMVRRLAEEARASAVTASERAQRRPAPSARAGRGWSRPRLAGLALAVAILPLLTAGLAVAGVRLPAVAENAFEAVGIDLPNQGSSDDPADANQGSGNDGEPAASPAAEPGSEKAVKGDKRKGNGPPSHSNAGGQGQGQGQGNSGSGGKAKGKPAAPPGQTKPKPDHGGGNAGGNGKSVGKGGTPPGQAEKPVTPGSSGSSGSVGQGQGQGQAKQKD